MSVYDSLQKKTLYGLINQKNEVLVPLIYDEIKDVNVNNTFFIVKKDGKFAMMNDNFDFITDFEYDKIELINTSKNRCVFVFWKAGEGLFFDVNSDQYLDIKGVQKITRMGVKYKVVIDGRLGALDKDLSLKIPAIYTSIEWISKKARYECKLPNGKKEYYDFELNKISKK